MGASGSITCDKKEIGKIQDFCIGMVYSVAPLNGTNRYYIAFSEKVKRYRQYLSIFVKQGAALFIIVPIDFLQEIL